MLSGGDRNSLIFQSIRARIPRESHVGYPWPAAAVSLRFTLGTELLESVPCAALVRLQPSNAALRRGSEMDVKGPVPITSRLQERTGLK